MAYVEYEADGKTIKARVQQKTDTLANWMANPMPLKDGEPAFVITGEGQPLQIRLGWGGKRFSELPNWIDFNNAQRVAAQDPGVLVDDPSEETKYMEVTEIGTYTYGGNTLAEITDDGYKATFWWTGTEWISNGVVRVKGDQGINGITTEPYTETTAYSAGSQVYYKGNSIYKTLVSTTAGESPETNPDKFELILDTLTTLKSGKNKFNKSKVSVGKVIHTDGTIIDNSIWSTSERITVRPNTDYAYTAGIIAVYNDSGEMLLRQDWNMATFKTPATASYVYYSVPNDEIDISQLEEGAVRTAYESYTARGVLDVDKIVDNSIPKSKLTPDVLVGERSSRNLANYRTFKDGFYISEITGLEMPNSTFSVSPFIAIKPDTYYIQPLGNRVAFYSSASESSFISGMPPIDTAFKSPVDANFIKVCTPISTKKTYQLEEGTTATEYEDYLTYKLPKSMVSGLEDDTSNKVENIPHITKSLKDNAPAFYKLWMLRDSDVTVVLNGESISTTNYYAEPFSDAKNRPPLMTEKNYTAYIEESLRWEGQKYFRFDNAGLFTETAITKTTKEYDRAWDWTRDNEAELPANNNRPAITRILEGTNCSVSYLFPNGHKRCDFIYRTDYLNAPTATVSISGGNGKVQVYNENTSTWVEANGFSYSAKEDGVLLPHSLYKSIYQKRLKMRKVNINETGITVTITNNGSGRLTYWGIQTSPLENMFDFILSARGGHSISRLENFEAWDTDYFKPQLILWQVPIINEGLDVGNADFTPKTLTKTKEQYALGITNKYAQYVAKSYSPEVVSYMLWFGLANNGIDNSDNWVFGNDPNGNKVSIPTYIYHTIGSMEVLEQNVLDIFSLIDKYSREKVSELGGNIIGQILQGSGMAGGTMTIDGVHYNTNGNRIVKEMFSNYFIK